MKIINTDKIVNLQIHLSKPTHWFHWREGRREKKFLFWTIQKEQPEGWYSYGDPVTEDYILKESSRKDYLFKNPSAPHNKSIWDKPFVEIRTVGGKYMDSSYVYFNTDQDAQKYAQDISKNFPHIEII